MTKTAKIIVSAAKELFAVAGRAPSPAEPLGGLKPGHAVLPFLIAGLAFGGSLVGAAMAQTASSPVAVHEALPQKTDFMQTIRLEVQAFATDIRGMNEADAADCQALSAAVTALEQASSRAAAEQARERLAKVNAKILQGVDERSGKLATSAAAFAGKMNDLAAIERQLLAVHDAKVKQFEARASNAANAEANVHRALAELRDELAARGMWPLSAQTPAHIRSVFSTTLDAAGMAALDSGIAAKTRDAVTRARRDSETRAAALETQARNAQRWAEAFKVRQGTVRDVTELFAITRENAAMNRAFGETQELMAWVDRTMASQGDGVLPDLLKSIEGADVGLQIMASPSSTPEDISRRVDAMLGTGPEAKK